LLALGHILPLIDSSGLWAASLLIALIYRRSHVCLAHLLRAIILLIALINGRRHIYRLLIMAASCDQHGTP
jgi:hypothetical protein